MGVKRWTKNTIVVLKFHDSFIALASVAICEPKLAHVIVSKQDAFLYTMRRSCASQLALTHFCMCVYQAVSFDNNNNFTTCEHINLITQF